MRRRLPIALPACLALAVLATLLTLPAVPRDARAQQDEGALRDQIERQRGSERRLESAAARLGALEDATQRAIGVLGGRLASAQAELDRWSARLAATESDLRSTRRRLMRLRARLATSRRVLADVLRRRFQSTPPDVVSVVLDARGFSDVLERLDFLRRIERRDLAIVGAVRAGRRDAGRDERRLATLAPLQRARTAAVASERDALARIGAALAARRATLARVRSARLAALGDTRSSRRRAQRALGSLLAARDRAARSVGPGGPWAIPWPIVECESGGQNLPPNGAGASGYYQFLTSTWRGLGGSTPHAYQASKAEQDRLAGRLWNGGAGAGNWVCAGLVAAI